jgi:hypothetical protein
MSVQYHYSRGGQSFGPVSVEQLRQLASAGQISATDLVWRDGLAEWVPAGRLKGLFAHAGSPAEGQSAAAASAAAPAAAGPAAAPAAHAAAASQPIGAAQASSTGMDSPVPSAFPPTESSPDFSLRNATVRPVPHATESSPDFRLAELGPPPPRHYVVPPTAPAKSEPARDTTQVEVFAQQAKVAAMAAGSDALKAFKVMAKNPVGGLRTAYENLGAKRAMAVGIFFAALYAIVFILAGRAMVSAASAQNTAMSSFSSRSFSGSNSFSEFSREAKTGESGSSFFGTLFKLILLSALPFGVAVGGFAAVRAMFKGEGTIFSDMFVAGASLVPPGVFLLIAWVLGAMNFEIILAVALFAMTTSVLILYSGFTTLLRVSEAVATIAIPLMILAVFYVTTVVLRM